MAEGKDQLSSEQIDELGGDFLSGLSEGFNKKTWSKNPQVAEQAARDRDQVVKQAKEHSRFSRHNTQGVAGLRKN